MKVYIAGPITGVSNYKENFQEAEDRLKEDFDVYNPVKIKNPYIIDQRYNHHKNESYTDTKNLLVLNRCLRTAYNHNANYG